MKKLAASKIVVIDDDPLLRMTTRRVLDVAGYQVWEAADAEAGLRLVAEHRPSLVLLDYNLPGMDGLEVCRRIKTDPELSRTFVVIISGTKVDIESQVRGLETGADGYLTRPISNRELLARAQSMLRIKAVEDELEALRRFHAGIVESMGEGIVVEDLEGRFMHVNPAGAQLLGYTPQELIGKQYIEILPPDQVAFVEQINQLRWQGQSSRYELQLRHRDGSLIPVQVSGSPRTNEQGQVIGALAVFTDLRQVKKAQRLVEARLQLAEYANQHSLAELMQYALDEICELVDSPIAFYHFVEADQETLSLQAWSTRTLVEFCTAEGKGLHYPISQAGVWVDCVNEKRPVIHNDYLALAHRKGLPAGHAPVQRELVVPILRQGLVVAIFGVGNKPADYDAADVEIVTYMANVAWDIYELQKTQQELQASERQYRQLFDESISGFALHELICDEAGRPVDYRFLSANPAFEKLTGLKAADIVGRRVTEVFPDIESVWIERYGQVALSGEPGEFEAYSAQLKKHYAVRAYAPAPGKFATLFEDITERKRAEEFQARYQAELERQVAERTQQLQAAQEQLVRHERLAVLGQLAGGVGHELRNPLGVISNAVHYLKLIQPKANTVVPEQMTEKFTEYLTIIQKEVRMAEKIISDLLGFARIKSMEQRPVAVSEVIRQVLDRFPPPDGVGLVLDLPGDLPPALVDPLHLEQALGNLVLNACQSMPNGGQLRLAVEAGSAELSIRVGDTGLGIPAENLEKLFEPLFTTKTAGIGLGLPVSKLLVEANGGRIEVQSEVGRGSVFAIYIPQATASIASLQLA